MEGDRVLPWSMSPQQLYDAATESMRYCIGVQQGDTGESPTILIRYEAWSTEQLLMLVPVLATGLHVNFDLAAGRLYLQSRGRLAFERRHEGQTERLEAPAWDATLENIRHPVLQDFHQFYESRGGFDLIIQAQSREVAGRIGNAGNLQWLSSVRPTGQI